jgi:hypothetical protein
MANRYWVGGTGNWDASTTTHWSATNGGAGGASVPTTSDAVFFTSLSGGGTVTVTAQANCHDMDFNGWTGTFTGTSPINCVGSFIRLTSGMTYSHTGLLTIHRSSGTTAITFAGKTITSSIDSYSPTGLTMNDTASFDCQYITAYQSNLILNGKSITISAIYAWLSCSGSAINFTFNGKAFTAGGNPPELSLLANLTCTGAFAVTSNNTGTGRVTIKGSGGQRTITAATVTLSGVNLYRITGAGAGSWNLSGITGGSGDCGENVNITFTTPTDQHWLNADGGNWSDAANWTSRVPLPQDNALFDRAFNTAKQIIMDMWYIGSFDFTGATWTTSLTLKTASPNPHTIYLCGGWKLINGLAFQVSQGLNLIGDGTNTLDSQGAIFQGTLACFTITGTYKLTNNLYLIDTYSATLEISAGTFTCVDGANNWSITADYITCRSFGYTKSLALGSGTHYIKKSFTALSGSIAPNTATIKFYDSTYLGTVIFNGAGETYGTLWLDRGNSTYGISIRGSNTFYKIKDTGTAHHHLGFYNETSNNTVTEFEVNGSAGNLIAVQGGSTSATTLTKAGGGKVFCDYLELSNMIGSPINTWYMGFNSTDVGNTCTNMYLTNGSRPISASGSLVFGGSALRRYIAVRDTVGSMIMSGVADARLAFNALVSGAMLFSGTASTLVYLGKAAIKQKLFLYKVYDSNGVFLGVLDDVISDPSWSAEINSAGSTTDLTLARNADSSIVQYEPLQDSDAENILDSDANSIETILATKKKVGVGSILAHDNRVDIFMFNEDYPNGLKKFSGFISEITIEYGYTENTKIQLTSYGYDLDNYPVVDSSGNTTVPFNSYEPADIVRDAIDQFKADGIDTYTDYSVDTIVDTGAAPVSYTFRANTYRELLDKAVQLAPSGYSYHVGLGDNLIRFKPKPTSVDHKFLLGKHIKNLTLRSYTGDVVNDVLFTGGGTPESLFIRTTIAPLAGTRRGLLQLSDSRVELVDSASILSTGAIDDKKNIQYRSTIDILDTTYDIESIEIGDLVGFGNFDNFVDGLTMQIVAMTYSPDVLNIQLDTIPRNINKRLEELRKSLMVSDNTTVPDVPA